MPLIETLCDFRELADFELSSLLPDDISIVDEGVEAWLHRHLPLLAHQRPQKLGLVNKHPISFARNADLEYWACRQSGDLSLVQISRVTVL